MKIKIYENVLLTGKMVCGLFLDVAAYDSNIVDNNIAFDHFR